MFNTLGIGKAFATHPFWVLIMHAPAFREANGQKIKRTPNIVCILFESDGTSL